MSVKETLDAKYNENYGSGERILNQYIITEELGSGAYGIVYLARDTLLNIQVAIKECSKSKLRKQKLQTDFLAGGGRGRGRGRPLSQRRVTITRPNNKIDNPMDLVKSEVAILKKMSHRNIVKLYEVLDDPEQDYLFMVFELCERGSCISLEADQKAVPLPPECARNYFQQLILAIEYRNYSFSSS